MHHSDVRLRTAPTFEPITLAELKLQLRMAPSYTTEDAYLTGLITASRKLVEKYTRLTLPQTAWTLWRDRWPGEPLGWWDGVRDGALKGEHRPYIELPRPPLVSIDAVQVYNDADEMVVAPSGTYFVSLGSEETRGRITLRTNAYWPVALRAADAIEIQFTSGWANIGEIPEGLKTATRMIAAWLYINRGDFDDGVTIAQSGAGAVLESYKVYSL